jgi:hypothetical protein
MDFIGALATRSTIGYSKVEVWGRGGFCCAIWSKYSNSLQGFLGLGVLFGVVDYLVPLGDLITLPLSGISGVPSPIRITGDPGSGGGDGFALATPLVSPSPSSKLQEFPSSKGLRGGVSVF